MGQYGEKKPMPVLLNLVLLVIWSLVALSVTSPLPPSHPPTETSTSSLVKPKEIESEPKDLKMVKRDVDEDEEEVEARMEYGPMLISKKSANVLNRLVNAMRSSFDQAGSGSLDLSREKESSPNRNIVNNEMLNLQRRTQKDRKNYLRCYFNAVSCF